LFPSPVISSDTPKEPYKVIPANTAYEGKQRFSCANCHSDTPSRHYYLQCDKVCQFKDCIANKSLPHWGNTCPVLANHLKSKRANSALSRQSTSKTINQFESLRFEHFCDAQIRSTMGKYDYLPGINSPYDAGIQISSPAILDTGANNTYVNDRRLLTNLTSASDSVEVADGTHHTIVASGTLVNHPSIPAHYVPSFKTNLLGISPIIDTGAVGIIQSNQMTLVKNSPLVDKILNFVLKYSNDNNLIILSGKKSNDLYITNLHPKVASLSISSRHFPSVKEMVYYFYIVFNCPNVDTYCHLLSIPTISGFPPSLTAKNVRKHYPYNDAIRSQSQQ